MSQAQSKPLLVPFLSTLAPREQKSNRNMTCIVVRLTTETVQGAALPLEGVDNIERGDSFALGMLSVGDGVTDDTLEEGFQDGAGLLVDHCLERTRRVST